MIMVCHEANDIFLELAKMAKYAGKEAAATATFVIFTLSWFATRIYFFPMRVIRSTLWEARERAAEVGATIDPHNSILNGFLIFLVCLHIYWSFLILNIVYRSLLGLGTNDIREEDEVEAAAAEKERRRRAVAPGPVYLNPTASASIGSMPQDM
jgi:hypothetical protein